GRAAGHARIEVEESAEMSARSHELAQACPPFRPQAARQCTEKGALVDHVEGRLGNRREEVGPADAVRMRAEDRTRSREGLGAEVDAENVPSRFGEAPNVPAASATRDERAGGGMRSDERPQLRRHPARIPGRK